jgi:hypothetical protein
MDEVHVDAVDLGDELGQRVQACLDAPEVVVVEPVPRELFDRGQLDACERSVTSSLSGQRVAAMRRRRSSSSACPISNVKGRISVRAAT